jgi:hypothetical protein
VHESVKLTFIVRTHILSMQARNAQQDSTAQAAISTRHRVVQPLFQDITALRKGAIRPAHCAKAGTFVWAPRLPCNSARLLHRAATVPQDLQRKIARWLVQWGTSA